MECTNACHRTAVDDGKQIICLCKLLESDCLRMHVSAFYGMCIDDFFDACAESMNIDRIVHQTVEIAVFHKDFSAITGQVQAVIMAIDNLASFFGIRTEGNLLESQIFIKLAEDTQTACCMNGNIFKANVPAVFHKDSGMNTLAMTQYNH